MRLERAAALAGLALGRYGLRGARLYPVSHGFKQVFLVESRSHGCFVLRMYGMPPKVGEEERSEPRYRTGPGLRSLETLRAQLSWLSALRRETDLAVPQPVPLPDGSLVGEVSFAGLPPSRALLRRVSARHGEFYRPDHPPRRFALLRYLPGETRREPSAADLSRVGRLAAGLHDHAERYRSLDASALPRWDWSWPFGASAPLWDRGETFYSTAEMSVFEEVARRVRGDCGDLGHGSEVFGPIHRDLNLKNLLFGARHEGAGVTDFDQCGLGYYLLDLSVVLRALRPLWRHGERPGLAEGRAREALFEGYEEVRELPANHERRLGAFDAMQRVAAVNRTLDLRATPAECRRARGDSFLRESVAWLERSYPW
ncbi:phosphotransferase enzyme family protein [Rubrobacter tropicus]|uniref:phosphotransferase enzyme family protein n=1 Tax=Rubrobacter tropicus TaxID=2653851 RepID=UPI00140E312E|nr:phosphotransferase [Rubrobacter tropicus]